MLRKQYHRRQVGGDVHIWDVHRLLRAARSLPIQDVPLNQIAELDEDWWYAEPGAVPTPRFIADHVKLVHEVDPAYPILLCAKGRLMDGMHRVVRALSERRDAIRAKRFAITPPPDFVNVSLDDLPYPDEAV